MKFRQYTALLLCAAMLAGCGSSSATAASTSAAATSAAASASAMTPGTYTGTAEGKNGNVSVDVTVTEDAITAVTVGDNHETAGLADPAIETIPENIVKYQTLKMDMVSGATYTSVAILQAVSDAITQAGGDPSAFNAEIPNDEEGTSEELTADVAVIGGGAAGMAATIELESLGKSVVLVEKTSSLGGTIRVSGGNQVVTGSKAQAEAGVTDDSAESMEADFMANGDNLNDPDLLALYAENVGTTTDWLIDTVGVTYDMDTGLHTLAEYSKNRELAYTGGGAGAAEALSAAVEKTDAQVLLNTTANSLIVDDNGAVTGVEATSQKGKSYTIHAGAVLLATGGYGNNNDLLPEAASEGLFYGLDSSAGQGLQMAVDAVNADTTHMEYIKEYPNGVEVAPKHAKSTIAGNIGAFNGSAILVNDKGVRVVNEKASNHDILNVLQQQDNQELYLVMDSDTFSTWKTKLAAAGLTEDMIDSYVENNGASEPVFTHGDTLQEAASAAGIDGDALAKTVETFNSYVDAGEDADFGRGADYLTTKIGDGPYYIVEQKARYATTMGGLKVNGSLNVMNKDGKAVTGLYAAGEVVGGQMGDDSPSGANNGWALTSGKYAADVIAALN
jgi:urocanate reductase